VAAETLSVAAPSALAPASRGPILVDTSVWIEALRPQGAMACKQAVQSALAANTAATCEIVIAEVLQGVADGVEAGRLEQRLEGVVALRMDGVGSEAARISRALRDRGLAVKFGDLLIGAAASVNGAALMHRDKHLSVIAQVAGVEEIIL